MTLIVGQERHEGPPKTHAFIVGVGRYPHLSGGGRETPGLPPLAQLTSPPISARALANWLIGTPLKHDAAPLGSVEMLLSDAGGQNYDVPGGTRIAVEDATSERIEAAFGRWYDRCDAHRDNVALFYFCGHGVQKDVLMLLPENVGASSLTPWAKAIDFDASYRGMARCAAETQYYFIDACRQLTTSMLKKDFKGWTLIEGDVWQQNPRIAPKLYATTIGHPAFGDANEPSRYTRALLQALGGGGADKQNGRWVIDTSHLGSAVQKIIDRGNLDLPHGEQQKVVTGGDSIGIKTLHVLDQPPDVLTTISCEPPAATDVAELYLKGRNRQYERVPATAGAWLRKVEAGIYEVAAKFSRAEYPNRSRPDELVRPPECEIRIEVAP